MPITIFHLEDFDFIMPEQLIARYPKEQRSHSRLLHVQDESIFDRQFTDIIEQFNRGDLLILNNTKVMPARI